MNRNEYLSTFGEGFLFLKSRAGKGKRERETETGREKVKAHWKNHVIRPFRQACIDIGITDQIPTYTYSNKSISKYNPKEFISVCLEHIWITFLTNS